MLEFETRILDDPQPSQDVVATEISRLLRTDRGGKNTVVTEFKNRETTVAKYKNGSIVCYCNIQ
jgi:hypothetical protein